MIGSTSVMITRAPSDRIASGAALANVAVTGNDHDFAGDHDVGRALDAVGQRLAATIEIVEFALGHRVVHVNRRDLQLAPGVHLIESMDAGRRLLRQPANAAEQFGKLLVDHGGQVAAVVQNQIQRLPIGEEQTLLDAPVELFRRLALPGVNGDARFGDRGGGVVLRRKNVAATPGHFRAEFDESLDQDGCLNCHMQAAGDAGAVERASRTVFLPQGHQPGHFVLRQHDLLATPAGQGQIGDFVRQSSFDLGHCKTSR